MVFASDPYTYMSVMSLTASRKCQSQLGLLPFNPRGQSFDRKVFRGQKLEVVKLLGGWMRGYGMQD